ncbi:MAG: hypothetical protein WCG75_00045 [Armatimonadota bacterium]
MWKLLNAHFGPRGGWTYRIPENGIIVNGGTFEALVTEAANHYRANNLCVPADLENIILAYACQTYAECSYDNVPNAVARGVIKSWQLTDVIRFSKTMFDAMISGEKVDQTEADRRARICSTCPFNVQPDGCLGCNSRLLKESITALTRAGKTQYDSQLMSCKFCGCFINAMVWFPLSTLQKFTDPKENSDLPDYCWKKAQ